MNEEAQKRIAECKSTKSKSLDLSKLNLTEIPAEINELVWLEELNLHYNQISEIKGLEELTALTELYLSINQISEIKGLENLTTLTKLDLSSNQISEIKGLVKLTALTKLWLPFNQVSEIKDLEKLTALKDLRLHENQIIEIRGLEKLTALKALSLGSNQISEIKGLEKLIALKALYISSNQISEIKGLEKLTTLKYLILHSNQISEIKGLVELSALTGLDLSSNQISEIKGLEKLTALTTLSLPSNQISEIKGLEKLTALKELALSSNQISEIKGLKKLTALKELALSSNQISEIQGLEKLTALTRLWLRSNQISEIKGLEKLIALKELRLHSNQISEIKGLEKLTALTRIELGFNQIRKIKHLDHLKQLNSLNLQNNKIEDLSKAQTYFDTNNLALVWKDRFSILLDKGINLYDNPIKNPPIEIVKQGKQAILNWFQQGEEEGFDYLYEAKMLIVGEGGAGKTSLAIKLKDSNANLPEEEDTTKGIVIEPLKFITADDKNFTINVWDFGGQEIYKATHQFFLTKRSLYVLVDDTRKTNVTVNDATFKYWLQTAELFGDNSPLLIVQNEKGDRSKDLDIKSIKAQFDFVKEVYTVNLKTCRGLDAVEKAIQYYIQQLPHIGDKLPKSWISLREDITQLSENTPYISYEQYLAIALKHKIDDRTKANHISAYLHDLGTILHYHEDDLLKNIVILQNTWATTAVYKVLDDETIKTKNRGIFKKAYIKQLWCDEHYADKQAELLQLMQKFELCYKIEAADESYLIPQLLPESEPENLVWEERNNLKLKYKYKFMPKGLLSRLNVRTHQYIKDLNLAWKNGLVVEKNNSKALIRELYAQNEIEVKVVGSNSKELISIVQHEIDALNRKYEGMVVEKLVPCICATCKTLQEPRYYKYEDLLKRKEKGKQTIECLNDPFEDVSVSMLLDNYEGIDKDIIKQLKIYFDEIQNLVAENKNLREEKTGLVEDLDKTTLLINEVFELIENEHLGKEITPYNFKNVYKAATKQLKEIKLWTTDFPKVADKAQKAFDFITSF